MIDSIVSVLKLIISPSVLIVGIIVGLFVGKHVFKVLLAGLTLAVASGLIFGKLTAGYFIAILIVVFGSNRLYFGAIKNKPASNAAPPKENSKTK